MTDLADCARCPQCLQFSVECRDEVGAGVEQRNAGQAVFLADLIHFVIRQHPRRTFSSNDLEKLREAGRAVGDYGGRWYDGRNGYNWSSGCRWSGLRSGRYYFGRSDCDRRYRCNRSTGHSGPQFGFHLTEQVFVYPLDVLPLAGFTFVLGGRVDAVVPWQAAAVEFNAAGGHVWHRRGI